MKYCEFVIWNCEGDSCHDFFIVVSTISSEGDSQTFIKSCACSPIRGKLIGPTPVTFKPGKIDSDSLDPNRIFGKISIYNLPTQ